MKDVLEFIFTDIWHFLGIVVLISIIVDGIVEIVNAYNKKNNG